MRECNTSSLGATDDSQPANSPRSAAPIKRGDEVVPPGDLRHHLATGHDRHPRVRDQTLGENAPPLVQIAIEPLKFGMTSEIHAIVTFL
jgi:hypothetical protein